MTDENLPPNPSNERRQYYELIIQSIRNAVGIQATVVSDYTIEYGTGLKRRIDIAILQEHDVYLIEVFAYRDLGLSFRAIDRVTRLINYALLSKQGQHANKKVHILLIYARTKEADEVEQPYVGRMQREIEHFTRELEAILPLYGVEKRASVVIDFEDLSNSEALRKKIFSAPELKTEKGVKPDTPAKKHEVFVSYRRSDSRWPAGRIADHLKDRFVSKEIFIDTRNINLGEDFKEAIRKQINASNVLLAVINRSWLKSADPDSGRRRLDSDDDFVRIEISAALVNDLWVIPILIDDTAMPRANQLPDDLKPLERVIDF